MNVYFNLHGTWVLLNNDTDYINGYTVEQFVEKLRNSKENNGYDYELSNKIVKIVYNKTKYCTDFSNLIFEGIEI